MNAADFAKDFIENVKSEAAVSGEGKCAVFVNNMAQTLIESEVLPDFTSAFYTGTGKSNRKYRVDGYTLDEFDMSLTIVIADYGDDPDRVLAKTGINQCLNRVSYFVVQTIEGNLYETIEPSTPCADLVDLIRTQKANIRKFKFLIFTDASVSATIKSIEMDPVEGIPVECQIWGLERLFRVCSSDLGRQNIEIDFLQYTSKGIPCLVANDAATAEYTSFLCVIPGPALADIYDAYGSSLLEANVRSFLSTKVAVNKKMRATILNEPGRFFAYNNGISAIAMDVKTVQGGDGLYIVSAKDFQIINGGQTTASLSNARYKDKAGLSSIYVQMKLTEIDESGTDESNGFARNISRSSNSQNKVSDADFFATSPFHVRMEQYSRRLFAVPADGSQYETHWFYERARGQYLQSQMRMTRARQKQFQMQNPKAQLITKTDLSKVVMAWRGEPQWVSKGAQTCFTRFAEITDEAWSADDSRFNEKYFEEVVALTIVYRFLEKSIPKQPWYESGYRANVIAYTMASVPFLLKQQKRGSKIDLLSIWQKQTIPESLSSVLLKLAEQIYGLITSEDRKVVNVTQWCKRDECWKYVQDHLSYALPDTLENCLISAEESKASDRLAKRQRHVDSGIDAQSMVVMHPAEFWERLSIFAAKEKLLNKSYVAALQAATKIPSRIPNAVQSKKLLELLEIAKAEGFKEQ